MQKAYYSPFDIKYKGLKLLDVPQQNISLHFPEVAAFIDEALAEGGEAFSEVRRKTPFLQNILQSRDFLKTEKIFQTKMLSHDICTEFVSSSPIYFDIFH